MAEFGPPPLITRDDLIDVLRRNFEPHWIELLLADPSSLSVFEGMIAALLRIQDAIDENLHRGTFVLTAPGRTSSSSTIRLQRPSGALVTIDTNIRFLDERGAAWRPTANFDIAASGGPQEVDVPIQTERAGYYLNSFEPLAYQALDALPDPTLIVIAGVDPATGGTAPFLDQHGKERRVFRASSETNDQYRNRIRFLEDQVSPLALSNTIVEVLDAFAQTKFIADLVVNHGLRAFKEPFRDTAQPAGRGIQALPSAFFDDSDPSLGTFFDDPSGPVLRDLLDVSAFFDVFIPTPIDPADPRRFYDDDDPSLGSFYDDPTWAYPDVPTPETITAPVAALADELDRRRAGGVRFRIWQGTDLSLLRHPRQGELSSAGDWVDQDGVATDLEMIQAVAAFDGHQTYVETAIGTGPGAAAAAGDLLFALADVPNPLSIDRVACYAQVARVDVGAGVDPSFQFLLRPPTAGAAVRVGTAVPVTSSTYREVIATFEENPITAAPWTLADVAGVFRFGCANVAAVGATDELRVSELVLEFVVSYG